MIEIIGYIFFVTIQNHTSTLDYEINSNLEKKHKLCPPEPENLVLQLPKKKHTLKI